MTNPVSQQNTVNDTVCNNIVLEDTAGVPILIWDNNTNMIINGTILVQNNGIIGVGATATLIVNGTPVGGFIVGPGESHSITINDINSIGIVGAGTNSSNIKVSFSINYKF
ncbi:hypothetical protein ABE42_30525 [Bacillus thuringiensis]|uniref:DUF3992 domain-containing protein n=1 Tax=Bacillus thuringiensis TaxID=1428 RepID=UPI0018F89F12|nr:S-Ena type endospore appendage [Bacillus thuringiensis]MBG9537568.1 hypothetical protein [Bacillus thuringiensis]MBG9583437.1 hypothetical protein [Bacillus thuringiensis]